MVMSPGENPWMSISNRTNEYRTARLARRCAAVRSFSSVRPYNVKLRAPFSRTDRPHTSVPKAVAVMWCRPHRGKRLTQHKSARARAMRPSESIRLNYKHPRKKRCCSAWAYNPVLDIIWVRPHGVRCDRWSLKTSRN